MSDAHNEHQSGIKTPKQLIAAVAAGFLVPIVCIVLLVEFVTSEPKEGAGSKRGSNRWPMTASPSVTPTHRKS